MSPFTAVLSTGSPTTLTDQLILLDRVAKAQRDQISDVANLRDKYAGDKKTLDDLVAAEAVQDAQLAAQKKDIEAWIANLQKLRQQANGSTSSGGSLRIGPCPRRATSSLGTPPQNPPRRRGT